MTLRIGTLLGPYEIVSPLGAGSMGEVYRARDRRLDRIVAVKVLPDAFAADAQFRDRFEREARAIASLSHPNICTLHDVGEQDGRRFLVMEHLEGETLAARLKRERVPYGTLLDWAVAMADALACAHGRSVLHRDLKPANLLVTTSGAIKILDFGLARSTRDAVDAELTIAGTQAGVAVGTVAYMSPEQARGERLDGRSDLFSLGAVLYEAATGTPAFPGPTSAVVFEAIFAREVPVRRTMPGDVPPGFADVIERLLAKRADRRYPDAGALAAALRELEAGSRPASRRSGTTAATRVPSIAVLPFADMSPHRDQDYFCEGMAEELINALARLSGLHVASRTSAFRFKAAEDIRRIGEELRVETVLEGSVRTAGPRLRVTAQLVKVADGYHLWSERFDRQLEDVFDIQDQIARAIVDALKVTLLGDRDAAIVKPAADNIEVYQLCLKARYHWHRASDEGFGKAFELFEQAARVDPNCALAQFGLGDCCVASGGSGMAPVDSIGRGRSLIETALRLDPDLAEAHAILGVVQGMCGGWQWDAAERSFAKALEISPRSAHARSTYALHLMTTARPAEAIRMAREAVALDPLLPSWHMFEAHVQYAARRFQDAQRAADVTLSLDPRNWTAHGFAGLAALEAGDVADALRSLERAAAGGSPYQHGWLGFGLAKAGRRAEAEQKRRELIERAERNYVPPLAVVCVSAGLGDRDDAWRWLERAVEQRDPQLAYHAGAYPILDSLRGEARLADLLRRMGLGGHSLS